MRSELSWTWEDFNKAGQQPPSTLSAGNKTTEGLAMSDTQIQEYLKDSLATLHILKEKHSDRAPFLKEMFLADLEYLWKVERISRKDYDLYMEMEAENRLG